VALRPRLPLRDLNRMLTRVTRLIEITGTDQVHQRQPGAPCIAEEPQGEQSREGHARPDHGVFVEAVAVHKSQERHRRGQCGHSIISIGGTEIKPGFRLKFQSTFRTLCIHPERRFEQLPLVTVRTSQPKCVRNSCDRFHDRLQSHHSYDGRPGPSRLTRSNP
jgi:hypothetical protein